MQNDHRRPSRLLGAIALVAALAVAGAACGSAKPKVGADQSAPAPAGQGRADDVVIPAAGPPAPGGRMVYGVNAETDGWNPTSSRWSTAGLTVANTIFDPLAAWDTESHAQPYLAASFAHNDTYDVWTITMRENETFHDGTPVDAVAVKKDLDAIRTSVLTSASFAPMQEITVTGPLTLDIAMKIPWSVFPAALTGQSGMIAAPKQLDDAATGTRQPIGSGPFVFQSWTPDSLLTVKKNANYWRPGLPYLDQIDFKPISEPQSQYDALRSGDVNMMATADGPTKVKLRAGAAAGDFQIVNSGGETDEGSVMLNTSKGPTSDVRLRTALAYATDTAAIAKVASTNPTDIARGPFVDGTNWAIDTDYPSFDLDQAKSLVAEVQGAGPPIVVRFQCTDGNQILQTCQAIAANWEAAGVQVDLTSMDQPKLINNALSGDYEATIWAQFGAPDPDADSVWWNGANAGANGGLALNMARNQDPVLDAALYVGRTSPNPDERKLAYITVQQQLAKDIPYVWLNHNTWIVAAENSIRGIQGSTLPDGSPGANTISGIE
ncbi:MAG: ABC transporter substrate-binding protein, partial [Acidimicrobiales bacterium]